MVMAAVLRTAGGVLSSSPSPWLMHSYRSNYCDRSGTLHLIKPAVAGKKKKNIINNDVTFRYRNAMRFGKCLGSSSPSWLAFIDSVDIVLMNPFTQETSSDHDHHHPHKRRYHLSPQVVKLPPTITMPIMRTLCLKR